MECLLLGQQTFGSGSITALPRLHKIRIKLDLPRVILG